MAGIRVGYGLAAAEIIDDLMRSPGVFHTSTEAIAGAVASIDGEDQTYPLLQEAVNAAGEGATIRLLGDFTGNGVVVPAGKDITIDFGGYTYVEERSE